jgi:predicted nucleotidyltransferase component of viral defense system
VIDEGVLLEQSHRFRDLRQLEKDYLLTLLLYEIYTVFNDDLVFKGGTSLKYFYNLNRFSEDLDFSFTGTNNTEGRSTLYKNLNTVLGRINLQYPVVGSQHRGNKENGIVTGINYEVRIQGPLFNRLQQVQNINLDISVRQDVLEKFDLKYLIPAYQDIPTFSVPVMNAGEIVAEKTAAIIERDKMRDIYDLYFLLVLRGMKFNIQIVREKMKKRHETFDIEIFTIKLKKALNLMNWKSELSYLINPLPEGKIVVESLDTAIGLK